MDYQTYYIALSPDLELTPEEFATFWNGIPECSAVAQAHLSQAKGAQQFIDPLLAGALVTIITSVASSALYDLIKEVIHRLQDKKGSRQQEPAYKHIHIEELNKPDGTHRLVVDIDVP